MDNAYFFLTRQVDLGETLYTRATPEQKAWMVKGRPSPLERLIAHRVEVTPDQMRDALVARWSRLVESEGRPLRTDPLEEGWSHLKERQDAFLSGLKRYYGGGGINYALSVFSLLGSLVEAIDRYSLLFLTREDFRRPSVMERLIVTPDANYKKHGQAVTTGMAEFRDRLDQLRSFAHTTLAKLLISFGLRSDPGSDFRSLFLRLFLHSKGEDVLTDHEFNLWVNQQEQPLSFGVLADWEKRVLVMDPYKKGRIHAWGAAWKEATHAYSDALFFPRQGQEISLYRTVYRGFSLSWRGLENTGSSVNYPARLAVILDQFRNQAERYYPEALRTLPHLTVWAYAPEGKRTPSGHYFIEEGSIVLYASNMNFIAGSEGDLNESVGILAHEFGHHLFRQFPMEVQDRLIEVLQPKAYAPISTWIKGLELFSGYGTTYASNSPARIWLQKNDPVAYLQLEIASATVDPDYYLKDNTDSSFLWKPEKEQPRHMTVRQLKKLPVTYEVFKWPVTKYGSVNAEETFCEAFSLLIAYGPMAVLEPIREWIYRFIPKLRRNPAARMISNTEVITNTPELR